MENLLKIYFLIRQILFLPLFLIVALPSGAQDTSPDKLKTLFFSELSRGLMPGSLPDKNQVTIALIPASELGQYHLQSKPFDAFYVKAEGNGLFVGSRSVEGLQNGVYWYLHYLGYRYYFPNEAWHYVPPLATAFKPVNKTVAPSFNYRRIWYAYGTGSKQADASYIRWFNANLLGGEDVNIGHSYDAIVNRNKAVFLEHPEYFAQKVAKGKIPPNPKFEIANERLVQLVIKDAFAQIENKLQRTGKLPAVISLDPSDGGGFSSSPGSLKIGGPSEQAFYLANRVAKAVREKYHTIKIGLYAYNLHAAPPKFALEPNIVVLVATAMNQSAYRTDELIELWKQKGAQVGIRDYYGVMAWDWDMPGQPRGAKLAYIKQLKDYYKADIRYVSAETNIGWISRGLGHYIAAQLLWNADADIDALKNEFFRNMFGQAGSKMEELFKDWQSYTQAIPLDGDLYQWSKLVEEASEEEKSTAVQKRLDQVKQYLHYVYLFKQWKENSSDDNLVVLLNYAYRVQDEGIVASYPLFRRIANAAVAGKTNMRFNDPKAVWKKNNRVVEKAEIEKNFYNDLNTLNRLEKTEVVLFPAARNFNVKQLEKNKSNLRTSLPVRLRGGHKIVFQVNDQNAFINLSTGLIKAHQYKSLRLTVYPYNRELNVAAQQSLLMKTIQPRQPIEAIALSSLKPGVYIALIDDARNGFTMSFTGNVSYAIIAASQNRIWTFGRNDLVFAVGNESEFLIKNDGPLTIISPAGRIIDLQKKKGIFTIEVLKGEQGLWKIQRQSGVFHIQGILPFVSSDTDFLLLHS